MKYGEKEEEREVKTETKSQKNRDTTESKEELPDMYSIFFFSSEQYIWMSMIIRLKEKKNIEE